MREERRLSRLLAVARPRNRPAQIHAASALSARPDAGRFLETLAGPSQVAGCKRALVGGAGIWPGGGSD